jgi:hypothetical protein
MCVGVIVAAWHFPGGYDWVYTVATALASRNKNPAGGAWVVGALSLSMVLLWPCVSALKQGQEAHAALRLLELKAMSRSIWLVDVRCARLADDACNRLSRNASVTSK